MKKILVKSKSKYAPHLPEEQINRIVRELSNPKLLPNDYFHYQNTEEWVIIERLLKELENNEDIEIRTPLEYIIGYLVKELRNKDLPLLTEDFPKTKTNGSRKTSNGRIRKHV